MNLNDIRSQIDRVDSELVLLLHRRTELSVRARRLKTKIAEPRREMEVLERARRASGWLLDPDFTERVFGQIIAESRRLQGTALKLIGFQGEHGAFSEMAVRQLDPDAVAIPHVEFADVFDAVKHGLVDFGVVPVENSLGGNISHVDDLLIESDLTIVAEALLPIHQCLITLPETRTSDIRVVYSHPQALSQCRRFIGKHKLEARSWYDTAGAAAMLARDRPSATAAIAGRLCADLYGLRVVEEGIEDREVNITRFVMIAAERWTGPGDKCSVVFSTAHRPGALSRALRAFSESGINLTRIESRPVPANPGTFAFLLDFTGSHDDQVVRQTLETVRRESLTFKLLGCYRGAWRGGADQ